MQYVTLKPIHGHAGPGKTTPVDSIIELDPEASSTQALEATGAIKPNGLKSAPFDMDAEGGTEMTADKPKKSKK